jgi:hypothetical protein
MHAYPLMHAWLTPAGRKSAIGLILRQCCPLSLQGQPDGSNEAGAEEIPAIVTTKGIAADIQSGYTLHVHNGDLAYAECAGPHRSTLL